MSSSKVVKLDSGRYEVIKDDTKSFKSEQFEERYLEEIHSKYAYFLCDYSSGILRIKGFYEVKVPNYNNIPDYIEESCVKGCAYYILKRIKITENE